MTCERLGITIEDNQGNILDLTDKNQYFITGLQGFDHPPMRMNRDNLPGRDGSFLGRQNYSGRVLSISGIFRFMGVDQSRTRDQRYDTRKDFLCKISRFRNPVVLRISEQLDSGLTNDYRLECKVSDFNSNMAHNMLAFQFNLDLVSEFPFFQTDTENSLILSEAFIKPGDNIPDDIPDIIGTYDTGLNVAVNNGCLLTYPTIRFTGPITAPVTVANVTNNLTFVLNESLLVGDHIIVDNWRKTVIKNNAINAIASKSGEWIYLDEGNNIFLYTYGSGVSGTTTLFWRDNRLGF